MAYLRRFKKSHFANGRFSPEAFECEPDEEGISFHRRERPLDTKKGLLTYQASFAYSSGDVLGVCRLDASCFEGMNEPQPAKPEKPEPFEDLHCELRPCPDFDQQSQLAKCAVKLLDFTKKKDRTFFLPSQTNSDQSAG